MKQINFSVDDELHSKLQMIANDRGVSLADLARSFVRYLAAPWQTIKVSIGADDNSTFATEIDAEGKIVQLDLFCNRFWFGIVRVDDKFVFTNPVVGANSKIRIRLESGEQALACIMTFSFSEFRSEMAISGISHFGVERRGA